MTKLAMIKPKTWILLCLTVAISTVIPTIIHAESIESQEIETPTLKSESPLVLYGGERTRAQSVVWYLEELGIPYEYQTLDIRAGENKQPEYLAINPMGKVPALVDNDFSIWESGAILWYLASKYGEMPTDVTTQSETIQLKQVELLKILVPSPKGHCPKGYRFAYALVVYRFAYGIPRPIRLARTWGYTASRPKGIL